MPNAPHLRHVPTTVHGRYFVSPAESGSAEFWFLGCHGQAQTAEEFIGDLDLVPRGGRWLAAAVQGLNRWYAGRSQKIVANWMTSQDREIVIPDNVHYLDNVMDALEREHGTPRGIVIAGFSQGVAMAYRAGVLCRRPSSAIVSVCGDVPPELKVDGSRAWPRVLAMTGTEDTWYSPGSSRGRSHVSANAPRRRRESRVRRWARLDGWRRAEDCEAARERRARSRLGASRRGRRAG